MARLVKYHIYDHFLKFWFRFIYHNKSAVETGNFSYIKKDIIQNIKSFSGKILEDFFRNLFAASHEFNKIGSYWEKGHQNEIGLVAINDKEKRIVIAEIKLNKSKIRIGLLKAKSIRLLTDYKNYQIEYLPISLKDALSYLPD